MAEADIDAAASVVYTSFRRIADANNAFSFTASSKGQSRNIVNSSWRNESGITLVAASASDDAELLGFIAVQRMGTAWDLGPVAVSIDYQARGVGRALVTAIIDQVERSREQGSLIFLTVDTFNVGALALYCSCGFTVRAPVVVMELSRAVPPPNEQRSADDQHVRLALPADLADCAALSWASAQVDLSQDVQKHLPHTRVLLSPSGELLGYCTRFDMSGHLIASTREAAQALLCAAESDDHLPSSSPAEELGDLGPPRICVPVQQQPELTRWMLARGWRCVKSLLLMTRGAYTLPPDTSGAVFFPQC